MHYGSASMSILPLPDARAAVFLDFDGTLAEIAESPSAVILHAEVPALLRRMHERLDGAVAIVSGRPVTDIDAHLAPLRLPAAGVHGAERRRADGQWQAAESAVPLGEAERVLRELQQHHPSLLVETKPAALALHYRRDPSLEGVAVDTMGALLDGLPGMVMQRGKLVVELKPATARKDAALRAFMEEPPFSGRRPWFFGDDVTDEDGFAAVERLGGIAVKVGPGRTRASWRLDDVAALRGWLQRAAARLEALG